jgi:hypothetical protein
MVLASSAASFWVWSQSIIAVVKWQVMESRGMTRTWNMARSTQQTAGGNLAAKLPPAFDPKQPVLRYFVIVTWLAMC